MIGFVYPLFRPAHWSQVHGFNRLCIRRVEMVHPVRNEKLFVLCVSGGDDGGRRRRWSVQIIASARFAQRYDDEIFTFSMPARATRAANELRCVAASRCIDHTHTQKKMERQRITIVATLWFTYITAVI